MVDFVEGYGREMLPKVVGRVRRHAEAFGWRLCGFGLEASDVFVALVGKAKAAAGVGTVTALLSGRRLLQHDDACARVPCGKRRTERRVSRAHYHYFEPGYIIRQLQFLEITLGEFCVQYNVRDAKTLPGGVD